MDAKIFFPQFNDQDTAEDKFFRWALTISIAVHLLTLVSLSFTAHRFDRKNFKRLAVTYQVSQPVAEQIKVRESQIRRAQEDKPLKDSKISAAAIPSNFIRNKAKLGDFKVLRKQPSQMGSMYSKPKASLAVSALEKINNPKYSTFEKNIGAKIKQRVQLYLDHPDFAEGYIYLTFLLSANGVLQQIQVIEEKTQANEYLRKISMQSVEESSPFVMPADLNFPQLTFAVTIVFRDQ